MSDKMPLYIVHVSESNVEEIHPVMFIFDTCKKALEFVDMCLAQDLQARIRCDKGEDDE